MDGRSASFAGTAVPGLSNPSAMYKGGKVPRFRRRGGPREVGPPSPPGWFVLFQRGAIVCCIGIGLAVGLMLGLAIGLYATSHHHEPNHQPVVNPDFDAISKRWAAVPGTSAGRSGVEMPIRGGGSLSASPRKQRIKVGNAASLQLPSFYDAARSPPQGELQYESDRTDADAVPRLERQPVQAGGPMSLSGHPSEAAIAVAADVDVDPINPVTAQEEEAMRRGMAPAFGGVPAVASAAAVAGAGTDATDDRAQHVDDHTPQLEDNNRNLSQCPGMADNLVQTDTLEAHRFDLVLLATFPRSGSSWTRTLLRGATQIKTDLTTIKGLSKLVDAGDKSRCGDCDDADLQRVYQNLGIGWLSSSKKARPLYGIGGNDEEENSCTATYTKFQQNKDQPWPYFPHTVPLLIKTHYPQIGDSQTEEFTKRVTKVVHVVRNSFDSIASRFLGNQRQHQMRFATLTEARQNGTTTPEFDTFVRREADRMRAFYEYWAERRLADAERGIKTLYVRYEVLCERTSSVLDNVIEFIGYRSDKASLACTLKNMGCHSAGNFPTHLNLFTDEQIEFVLENQARLMKANGYVWDPESRKLTAQPVEIMCDYW